MGGSNPPPPNEQDIFAELQLETTKELKRLYGTVSDVKDDYCMVDGRYWLALNIVAKVASHQPKIGDDVCVMLTREGKEKEWVVDHLVQVFRKGEKEDCWDDSGGGDTNAVAVVEPDPNAKADTRLTGSVVSVKGSNVEVEHGSDLIVFSLTSAWKESFNPVELDMIQLDVKLQGDDLEDLSGCFVISASPARSMSGDGDVSHFFMAQNTGIISRSVFVWPAVCPHGYTPRRGDTVRYHGVECVPKQANHNCTWRATRVVPKDVDRSRPMTLPKEMLVGTKEKQEHQQQLMMNKEGIVIEEVIDFGCVVIGESLTKDVSVMNQGGVIQRLVDVTIKCPNDESQFSVETASQTDLLPLSSLEVMVTCTASQIGRTKVLAVFNFGEFSIGRHLMVEGTHPMAVHNNSMDFSCSDVRAKARMPIGVYNESAGSSGSSVVDGLNAARLVVPGRRKQSKKPPSFVTNRMKQYPIPEAILDELQYEDMVGSELIDRFPTLAEELSAENHEKKFHTLLHLEEVAVEHELQKHNLSCVPLQRAGPYLTLTVPGLVEKRPSLVLGDSAVLSVPGDSRSPRFEGCVHEVRAMEVLLKFDEKFHTMYCGEVYDVVFKTSRGQVRRQHQAVELSSQQLGYEVLFPEKVVLQEPQTCFIVEKEPVKMNYLKEKKTFSKFNLSHNKKTPPKVTSVSKCTSKSMDNSCDIEDKSRQYSRTENGFSTSLSVSENVSLTQNGSSTQVHQSNGKACDKENEPSDVNPICEKFNDEKTKFSQHIKSLNGSLQFVPKQVLKPPNTLKVVSKNHLNSNGEYLKPDLTVSPELRNKISQKLKNRKIKCSTPKTSWNPSWPDEEDGEDIIVESEADVSWEEADILIHKMTTNLEKNNEQDKDSIRGILDNLIDEALTDSKSITSKKEDNFVDYFQLPGIKNGYENPLKPTEKKENGFHEPPKPIEKIENGFHNSHKPLEQFVTSPTEPITHIEEEDLTKTPVTVEPKQQRKKSTPSDTFRKRAIMNNYPKSEQPENSIKSTNSQIFLVPQLETSKLVHCPSKRSTPAFLPHIFSLSDTPAEVVSGPLPYYPRPAQAAASTPEGVVRWVNNKLNPEQQSAVLRILSGEARPLPYVIYGPPGTGKTVTLVESILQIFLLRPDARILVATPSNSSADLIAERLHASGKIRFGDLARLNAFQRSIESVPEKIRPYCFVNDELEDLEKAARHKIMVSTCATAGGLYKLELRHGHFTHVLIDEAGHTTEPECLVPLGLVHSDSGQIVLAGDPKQLGPVLQSSLAKLYGLEESLLERLTLSKLYQRNEARFRDHGNYDPALLTKLVRNYRSHPDILSLPSRLFYDDELKPCAAESVMKRFLGSELLPTRNHPVVFHGIRGHNVQENDCPSWFNPQEAWQVVMYLQKLLRAGTPPGDIGIIAPYRKQVSKVKELIATLELDASEVRVGSVEEFQGQERSVILMTTVRSCGDHTQSDVAHGLGFLRSEKRFNVAVTRAQSLLVVVGDPHVLAADNTWRQFLIHVIQIGGYKGCDLPLGLEP